MRLVVAYLNAPETRDSPEALMCRQALNELAEALAELDRHT
jgi:hypothetical protein